MIRLSTENTKKLIDYIQNVYTSYNVIHTRLNNRSHLLSINCNTTRTKVVKINRIRYKNIINTERLSTEEMPRGGRRGKGIISKYQKSQEF